MKNTLGDLNNHLFAQLERLSNDGTGKGKKKIPPMLKADFLKG